MRVDTFTGTFRVWAYTVGHGRLLLRSTKSAARDSQIDILFKGVSALRLPTSMRDFRVSSKEPSPDELNQLGFPSPAPRDQKLFVLESTDSRAYVLALAMDADETKRDYHEPSPWMAISGASFGESDPRRKIERPVSPITESDWTEVWLDAAPGGEYLLVVRPHSEEVEIYDPQKGWNVVEAFRSYADAVHWLNEDEYDFVGRRWHSET
jgi:hypothetical protein